VTAALELAKRTRKRRPDWVWAKETVMLDALLAREPKVEAEVQAIQVGPVVRCRIPPSISASMASTSSGQRLRSPSCGTRQRLRRLRAHRGSPSEHGGGYETRLTEYSNLEITAGNKFQTPASNSPAS
jgi:hypothetical protein